MLGFSHPTLKWSALLIGGAFVVVACTPDATPAPTEAPTAAPTEAATIAPGEASGASVAVTGLAAGDVVTDNELTLTVAPVGYEFNPAGIGKEPGDDLSHYHVVLDGALINAFASPTATVSLQNVAEGSHTVLVVPATNNHTGMMDLATSIDFEYQPESALPEITAAADAGEPTVSIVSPAAGDTVSGMLEVVIDATDFTLSGDLFGKANLDGFGHWHAFIDEVGMPSLHGMSGSDSMNIMVAGLEPGPHTIFAVLVDNLHAPFDPPVVTKVDVEVAGDDTAASTDGEAVAVSLQEWQLDPSELTLTAGTYTFDATNDGSIDHALKIEGEGIEQQTPSTFYGAGVTESFTVDLAPGTYEIYCPVAGHKDAGMVATVTVTA